LHEQSAIGHFHLQAVIDEEEETATTPLQSQASLPDADVAVMADNFKQPIARAPRVLLRHTPGFYLCPIIGDEYFPSHFSRESNLEYCE
jgi:hypothetical protein